MASKTRLERNIPSQRYSPSPSFTGLPPQKSADRYRRTGGSQGSSRNKGSLWIKPPGVSEGQKKLNRRRSNTKGKPKENQRKKAQDFQDSLPLSTSKEGVNHTS